jgi:site-specific DNA recombinase
MCMVVRAALYLRISKDSENRGLGVERQRRELLDLCGRKGWEAAGTYTDNDRKATRTRGQLPERPEFDRLRRDIELGVVDAVVAWDQDRMFRDPAEAETFILFCEAHKMFRVATVADDINIETGEGLLVWRIKVAVAAEETRKMSRRLKAKHRELAEKGLPGGGKRPYGFRPDQTTHDPMEAELIREAFDRVLSGEGRASVVADWNERGVVTQGGNPWNLTQMKRLLISPRLAGLRVVGGKVVGDAAWEPIVSREDFDAVQRLVNVPFTRNPTPRSYWLTGLLVCASCEGAMCGRWHHQGQVRRYVCPREKGCGKVGIDAEKTEHIILTEVLAPLSNSPHVHQAAQDEEDRVAPDELRIEVESITTRLSDLNEAFWQRGEMSRQDFDTNRLALQSRLDQLNSTLDSYATIPNPVSKVGDLLGEWEEWDVGRRSSVARWFIARVTIQKATKVGVFDPSRVGPVSLAVDVARSDGPGADR